MEREDERKEIKKRKNRWRGKGKEREDSKGGNQIYKLGVNEEREG